jgi:hypothetical protein
VAFGDGDSDSDVMGLKFTRRGIQNGKIVNASQPEQEIFEFTQRDLVDGDQVRTISGWGSRQQK